MTTNGRVGVEEPEEDPRELLRELLEEVVEALGVDVEVQVEEVAGELHGRMEGEEVGLLIGRRGQTIDAIQHLAQRIVFKGPPTPPTRGASATRVTVDAGGYRERREQALRKVALDAAEDVLATGEAIELDPMPAAERRIVHEFLRDREDVTTHSEGEEPERYLVVEPSGA